MAHTHRCMVIGGWFNGVDEEGKDLYYSQLSRDFFDLPFRIRAISPPGEPQPVGNIMPDPNLSTWYVEGNWTDLQQIAADPDYPVLPNTLEEIPVNGIL